MSDDRYARQVRVPEIGHAGQAALGQATAVVVGVGATGSVAASTLVRAGVGRVRIVDRDVVERSNLQRQVLYTDRDATDVTPKVEAALAALRAMNPDVEVEGLAIDLDHRNVERVLAGASCVVDGTDNFETRYLLNDWCVREGVPWVYIGAVGTAGHTLTIIPGAGPCFRCYLPDPPPPGTTETCETAGVLGPGVLAIAAFGSAEAIKVCAGRREDVRPGLLVLDIWTQRVRPLGLERDPECPCCGEHSYRWLAGRGMAAAETLCGRDAVLVRPAPDRPVASLDALHERLRGVEGVEVRAGGFALRVRAGDLEATVFADGRAIVRGTADAGRARSFCARYLAT